MIAFVFGLVGYLRCVEVFLYVGQGLEERLVGWKEVEAREDQAIYRQGQGKKQEG
jgi:hypothetical protein